MKKNYEKILKEYSQERNINSMDYVVQFLKRKGIKHQFQQCYYDDENGNTVFVIKELGFGLFELNALELLFPVEMLKMFDSISFYG